jgi:orotidine-5'-phosphate decarboxylase
MDLAEKIIIALDVDTKEEALSLVDQLDRAVVFKVGLKLFTAEGPSLLRSLQERSKKTFLDLKLHDIPNTVAGAVKAAVKHGVHMMTLHAAGGSEMMARAVEAAQEEAETRDRQIPHLLAVTILTSLKDEQMRDIGMKTPIEEQVLRLARLAQKQGMSGVVCSPQEIGIVKTDLGQDFLVVAPGIRPSWAAADDQKRILTPSAAVQKGADYIVVGRPILKAPSPQRAFLKIVEELESAEGSS